LRYGRLYFREVSGNGTDFGHSSGDGGIVAFSRILGDCEVVIVANCGGHPFQGKVLVDRELNPAGARLTVAYSSTGSTGSSAVERLNAYISLDGQVIQASVAAVPVRLAPHEAQILA